MINSKMLAMLLVLLTIRGAISQSFTSEEGPYRTVISNVSSCAPPPDWFQWNITTFASKGRSLLRGTVSSSRSVKDLKFHVLMYYLEETKKTKVFDMKNQKCHNAIVELILKTIAVPFNEKTCRIKAGTYGFKDLNVDAIIHTVVQSLWYGAAQLRLDVSERKTSIMCFDVYFEIKKLQ